MRVSELLAPVKRSWVLAWLLVVLGLSLWSVWSSERVDSATRKSLLGHCLRQLELTQRANRDATDALIDQWNTERRLESLRGYVKGPALEAVNASVSASRRDLSRRLDDLSEDEAARIVHQLQVGDQIIPPGEFVTEVGCGRGGHK